MDVGYYNWLISHVDNDQKASATHQKLLRELFCIRYYGTTTSDINRAGDGVALRSRYTMLTSIDNDEIAGWLEGDCSVLEMLIAFSIRIENEYLNENKQGNRTNKWFWMMMKNLDLDWMINSKYDASIISDHIAGFLTKSGNSKENKRPYWLFWAKNAPISVAKMPIWDQFQVWIREIMPVDRFKIG